MGMSSCLYVCVRALHLCIHVNTLAKYSHRTHNANDCASSSIWIGTILSFNSVADETNYFIEMAIQSIQWQSKYQKRVLHLRQFLCSMTFSKFTAKMCVVVITQQLNSHTHTHTTSVSPILSLEQNIQFWRFIVIATSHTSHWAVCVLLLLVRVRNGKKRFSSIAEGIGRWLAKFRSEIPLVERWTNYAQPPYTQAQTVLVHFVCHRYGYECFDENIQTTKVRRQYSESRNRKNSFVLELNISQKWPNWVQQLWNEHKIHLANTSRSQRWRRNCWRNHRFDFYTTLSRR